MTLIPLNLIFTLFTVLTQAQDDKCAMISSWNGVISLVDLSSLTGSILVSGNNHLNALAPDRRNNIVYGLDWSTGDLYVVDMCGNGLFLKQKNVLDFTVALAYNPNTQLFYAIRFRDVYTINPNNNYIATLVTTSGSFESFESLVFNKDYTKLYGYRNSRSNPGLFSIDISSYTATLIAGGPTEYTYSIDWENENDESEMIIPLRFIPELISLDLETGIYTSLGSYPPDLSTNVRGMAMFYDRCDLVCNICPDYVYIDDGTARTQSEAESYCQSTFGTSLATITTTEQFSCAVDVIGDGDSPWIGLYDISKLSIGFFEFIDGTSCPLQDDGKFSGLCVNSEWWLNGKPIQICPQENGSKCVRLLPAPIAKVNNDIKCEEKLTAVLCNKQNPI